MSTAIVAHAPRDRHGIPVLAEPYEPDRETCPLCNGRGYTVETLNWGEEDSDIEFVGCPCAKEVAA